MVRRSVLKATASFAAILILAAGCSDLAPTAPQITETAISESRDGNPGLRFGSNRANVVKTRHYKGTYVATINPQGGTLDFGIGTLEFPKGAVSRGYRIRAVTDGESLRTEFGPSGLQFNVPAKLCYDEVDGEALDYAILIVDQDDYVLEEITSFQEGSRFCGWVHHFSKFVVGSPN